MHERHSNAPLRVLLGATWIIAAAMAGITPLTLGTTPAWAQEYGAPASGTYLRFELGAAQPSAGDANWLPPDFPEAPQIFFDLDLDTSAMAAIGIGHSYGNGWRAEGALNIFGSTDFSGPWSYTVPADPGPHAGMAGSFRSVALFANGYYDFETDGSATPFVTAGIGVARNTMDDWSRIPADPRRPIRTYEGKSDNDLAWSIGAGVAWDVGSVFGSGPAKMELAWRYYDLGSVSGGTTPLPGSGVVDSPIEALNFDLTEQLVSVGLRIPL